MVSSTTTEYRPIGRDGKPLYTGGVMFRQPDINWAGYFHNLRAYDVAYWEKRVVTTSEWRRDDV